MKDDLPYFSHDNDSRNHPKMKALRARYGWTGYGQFWALNEMVAGSSSARLDLSRKVVRASAACELGMTTDALDDFLSFLSNPDECGLIHYENGIVTTDRTQEDYARVKFERDRKRDHGKTSAEKRKSSAEESNNSAPPPRKNPTEESRGEEKREENTREDAHEILTFDGFLKTFIDAWRSAGCIPTFSDVLAVNLTTDERDKFGKASSRIRDIPRAIKAIQNYAAIQKSPDHEIHGNFKLPGFLISGIDDFSDDASPWTRYRKKTSGEQTPEERSSLISKIAAEISKSEQPQEPETFSDDESFADDPSPEPIQFDAKKAMADIRRRSGQSEARRA